MFQLSQRVRSFVRVKYSFIFLVLVFGSKYICPFEFEYTIHENLRMKNTETSEKEIES